ncbi:SusD/RagB family nutrient-binding outer membrane lipoprotein [Fulvivirgaceae bacterium BMA10]|uniref:SusD/RagB family nutrient-binding outer membrane lipoprotein n=1 Tax=Splendidivirga corallicola TaxID=3051826 RepID=A0ABT8KWK9_9BACT|nr:SusD/RagB family nutrient-binding outer membrane lipoprotein [Fulvivirgaceae bacterium BMA10]
MKKRYLYIKAIIIGIFASAFLVTSCDDSDFLDINTDPSFPADATNNLLMPAAQAGTVFGFSAMLERGAGTMVQHYINGRFDNYGFDGSTYNNAWSFDLYNGSLFDFKVIIDQGTALDEWQHVGVAKIYTAYTFSLLVDLFGDIPYSEALQADANFNPKADDGQTIYTDLFRLIDEGIADLDKESTRTLGQDDLIYGGNLDNWKKMANTLKLKMYNQIRLVDAGGATTNINTLIGSGNLISASKEDFTFQFTSSNSPDGRHPNFQADWAAGGLENNLASFMINLMNGNNDPRVPYYFYKQTGCNLAGRNGGESGNPGDDNVRAIHGIYPVGGKFDDNSCLVHNETLGLQGAGIFPMITYTMRLFIQSEAALTLGTTGDPRQLLEDAINSALSDVESMSGIAMDADDKTNYVAARMAAYDAAVDDNGRLGVIMMEKYVSQFGNGIESYNDLRRTGFPTNLNTPIVQRGPFPRRFPIPPVEVTANPNIDPLTDLTSRVFWDIN